MLIFMAKLKSPLEEMNVSRSHKKGTAESMAIRHNAIVLMPAESGEVTFQERTCHKQGYFVGIRPMNIINDT